MNFLEMLAGAQVENDSMLCVGLDPDPAKFPGTWKNDPDRIYDFCARIVDVTADFVIAFKPQVAYFAANRAEYQLEQLMDHIRLVAPHVPVILDFKRGDIGSTAEQYAKEGFGRYGADAVTLSPFLGYDSIEPYLRYEGKGAFLLCRTSNKGGADLQELPVNAVSGSSYTKPLYEHLAHLASAKWNTNGQLGLVVGATFPRELEVVRRMAPNLPLLIPGIGAQGGDAAATVKAAWRPDAPIIVNSSRAILYASDGEDFADHARYEAMKTRDALNAAKPK